jgi:hypothetical protein
MNEIQANDPDKDEIDKKVKTAHQVSLSDAIILIGAVFLSFLFLYTRDDPENFLNHKGGSFMIIGIMFAGFGYSIRWIILFFRGKTRKD